MEDSNLSQKVYEEIKKEYIEALKTEEETNIKDTKVAFSDVTVWFYKKDCQRALPEIKRIWEKVESTPLGTKSL